MKKARSVLFRILLSSLPRAPTDVECEESLDMPLGREVEFQPGPVRKRLDLMTSYRDTPTRALSDSAT